MELKGGLFFNRVLVAGDSGHDVVELFLVLFEKQVFSFDFIGSEALAFLGRAVSLLSALSGLADWSGDVDASSMTAQELISLVPKEFGNQSTFPRYEWLKGNGEQYWESPGHYIFQEGRMEFLALPQFRAGWGLSLQGLLVVGVSLVYYLNGGVVVPPSVPDPVVDGYWRGVKLPNGGGWLYFPKYPLDGGALVRRRIYTFYTGVAYPHYPYQCQVNLDWLFVYPPDACCFDLRYSDLNQWLECMTGFGGQEERWIIDRSDVAFGAVGELPRPVEGSGVIVEVSYTGRRDDYIEAMSWPPIVWFRERPTRPPRTIPPYGVPWGLPRFPGFPPFPEFSTGGGGGGFGGNARDVRRLTIAEKIVKVDGRQVILPNRRM